ncbi:phosphoglycerate mutase-like protein [Hypomontagnella submonticulosa]|nr:phosphoglycerate mutase-like protein [Hypomontagnella submonticulosa]
MSTFTYQVAAGFFKHDNEPEGPSFRATTQPGMGLINQVYETDQSFDPQRQKTQWQRFLYYVDQLNRAGGGKTVYKLVYVIRHGEGYHNVKEAQVGRHAWEGQWARLDGDGTISWSDATLTEKDSAQNGAGVPPPQRLYTSPLTRCLQTTSYAYAGVPFKPIIREGLRERNGVHTCDRRSPRSWIRNNFPGFHIGRDLTENDDLWKPDQRETMEGVQGRVKAVLDEIFSNETKTIISITAHSGLVRALYSVVGHRGVWVAAGAMVPVLISARKVEQRKMDETEVGMGVTKNYVVEW